MSINSDTGLWQCFKTGEAGDFYKLVSILEGIPFKEARSMFSVQSFLTESPRQPQEVPTSSLEVKSLKNFTKITKDMNLQDPTSSKAWLFIDSRKLWGSRIPFYTTTDKAYTNRIIIPLAVNKDISHFQARALDDSTQPKYINSLNIKKSHILYPYKHRDNQVIVCEGPLDAISLQIQGMNATSTMGCKISNWQAKMLSRLQSNNPSLGTGKIVLAFDNDPAGHEGLSHFEKLRKQCGMQEFFVCFPPKKYKDWNEAHVAGINLREYINKNTQSFSFSYQINDSLKQP